MFRVQKLWARNVQRNLRKKTTHSDVEDFICDVCIARGPGSLVGIANGYGLDGSGIESRWGARFSVPVQTGPGAHPASCTVGTGSFPR